MSTPYGPEVEATAELLYVVERKTREEVLELTGISSSTFDRWKKKLKWDEKRRLDIVSIPALVRDIQRDVALTYDRARKEERPLTSAERDGVFKSIKQMQQLDKGALFASHGIRVMDLFSSYLADAAPELRQQLIPHLVDFTQKLARDYVE